MNDDTPQVDAPAPAPEDIVKQEIETEGPPPAAAMVEPEDPKIPSKAQYTKAELEAAQAEIELLTPDAWIEMVRYIRSMENVEKLGEAPGIAWTTLYGAHGGQMNVTCRGVTGVIAADNMFDTVRHIMMTHKQMDWSPTKSYNKTPAQATAPAQTQTTTAAQPAPAQPTPTPAQPTYAPVEGSGIEKFTVQSVAHAISKNGHHNVHVITVEPALAKYGITAWKETVPVDFETWEVGTEYQPPDNMKFCLVDTASKPKKVTAFTDS